MLAGGFFAKILYAFFSDQFTVGLILIGAIAWEVFEYFKDVRRLPQDHLYKKNFFVDAFADVIGAVIMAIIVVF